METIIWVTIQEHSAKHKHSFWEFFVFLFLITICIAIVRFQCISCFNCFAGSISDDLQQQYIQKQPFVGVLKKIFFFDLIFFWLKLLDQKKLDQKKLDQQIFFWLNQKNKNKIESKKIVFKA